jgi:2,3-dihydroxy-p-cumate/2,3-dihydroxybenzoate 3,4-dioxygenase
VIELTDIAYVRSSSPDVEGAVRFAVEIVGLELVDHDGSTAYLRADQRHHCLAIEDGEPGVRGSGLCVSDLDALADAERELEAAGVSVSRGTADEAASRRVEAYIAFDDPAGNHIELVVDQAVLGRPVHFGRDAGIIEFGHICLDAPDTKVAADFYCSVFSAKLSDRVGDAARLLRIDPVHHKLAVFQSDGPGLCHINLQVASLDALMTNWRFLERTGVEIQSGPGRHPTSNAIFVYFSGPDQMTYEYSFGVRRIEDDAAWRPRVFPLEEPGSIDAWCGPTQRVTSQPQLQQESPVPSVAAPA